MKYAALTAAFLALAGIGLVVAPEGSFASSQQLMTVSANPAALPGSSAVLAPGLELAKGRPVRVVYVGR